MKQTHRTHVIAGLGVALALSACSAGDGSQSPEFDPDHIHSLAQEPGGRLLVATHGGLFALDEGGLPAPVNERTTDLMGFTVDESGDFFASGHPGEGEDGPSSLGLVTSTDGGASFEEVSLGGQADFHALESSPTVVYGVDGGTRLMRSKDAGLTWEQFELPRPVADIAADPSSETLLATSEIGLLRSDDGGGTFEVALGAPTLLLVDWSQEGELVGVDPSGQVFTATEPMSWTPQAEIGQTQAITVTQDDVIYAATESALLRSDDGGDTFESVSEW